MSCSTQSPKLFICGERMKVSLSCPCWASSPRITPSIAAGLSRTGTVGLQRETMLCARSRSTLVLTPQSAAGTRPNEVRAENRPPILGSPKNTCLKEWFLAISTNLLSGSVIATKCFPMSSEPKRSPTRL